MKLLEFFSVSNNQNEEEESPDNLGKDLAGYILDNDDIYKTKMLPIIKKMKQGESEEVIKELMTELVNDACLQFYKEEEFKQDPNKLFPKSARAEVVTNLIDLNKHSMKKAKKNENT